MRKYQIQVNAEAFAITVKEFSRESAQLEVNGDEYSVKVDSVENLGGPAVKKPAVASGSRKSQSASVPSVAPSSGAGVVEAPIPGAILQVMVKEGDQVAAGQPLLKMEAMKMENEIGAPKAGKIGHISVKPGDAVSQGQTLMTIE